MFEFSRRAFLQASSGALAACAVGTPLAAGRTPQRAQRTKVFTIFFGFAPSRDDTDLEPQTNEEIVRQLQAACKDVDFVVRDTTRDVPVATVINEASELRTGSYDGVLIFGWPRDIDLLRTGLPTINVAIVNDFMNVPYQKFKQNRVISAFLDPWKFCENKNVSQQMFQDLVDKIKLFTMLKRMKSERILTVTDSPYVNVTYGDTLKNLPEDYNQQITAAIKETFGTTVQKIGTPEVTQDGDIRTLWLEESKEANEIAERWIRNAEKMINTIPSEVVSSAKVYLAMALLLKKYDATSMAFHIRTLTPNPTPQDIVFPALATSEFQLQNIVAKCQSHLNILLSEMMLQYAYKRPSMLGDYSIDPYNNTSTVQHCEGPWNAWGDERRVPYNLTDHRERRVRQRSMKGVGAASWILYPADEPVTMWQIDVMRKEVLLHTGTTVPMLSGAKRYRDHFYEMM